MSHDRDPAAEPSVRADTLQVACFGVGPQDYALDIMRIKEIINPVTITGVPNAPSFVEGIIELRGSFLAVIDLRKRFGVAATPLTRDSKYIVVKSPGAGEPSPSSQKIGLVVDRVSAVQRLARAAIAPPPAAVRAPGSQFVTGLARLADRVVLVVDIDRILDVDEHEELSRVEAGSAV